MEVTERAALGDDLIRVSKALELLMPAGLPSLGIVSRHLVYDGCKALERIAALIVTGAPGSLADAVKRTEAKLYALGAAESAAVCDCQNPDGEGVRHVSMECPVHNDNPYTAGGILCSDCPPIGYPTDKTRCVECPRRA